MYFFFFNKARIPELSEILLETSLQTPKLASTHTKIPGLLASKVPERQSQMQDAFIGQSATQVIIFASQLLEKLELFHLLL